MLCITLTAAVLVTAGAAFAQEAPEGNRVVQRGDQEHHAQDENADPLKYAQRAGLQMHHVLGVVGVRQQARASQKS